VPQSADAVNATLEEFRAYLETLTFIQIDPRLRSKFGHSDVVQETLLEAYHDLERILALGREARKRWLRRMLMNNLRDTIERWRAGRRDARLEQSLDAAAHESSCRLEKSLVAEDSSPSARAAAQEDALRLLDALSQLDERQREAIIQQKYHGRTLAEIAEHLGCTVGAVAGYQARGLERLRQILPDME
jgi:RNA polymerase sigma-70 factor (subfamily 1)